MSPSQPGPSSPSLLTSLWLCQQPLPRQEKEGSTKRILHPSSSCSKCSSLCRMMSPSLCRPGALNRLYLNPLTPPACSQQTGGLQDIYFQQPLGGNIMGLDCVYTYIPYSLDCVYTYHTAMVCRFQRERRDGQSIGCWGWWVLLAWGEC